MPTIGVFVDLGGTDQYPSDGSLKNNSQWHHEASAQEWGFGYDTERQQVTRLWPRTNRMPNSNE